MHPGRNAIEKGPTKFMYNDNIVSVDLFTKLRCMLRVFHFTCLTRAVESCLDYKNYHGRKENCNTFDGGEPDGALDSTDDLALLFHDFTWTQE